MAWIRRVPDARRTRRTWSGPACTAAWVLACGPLALAPLARAADAETDAQLPPCPAQPVAPRPPTNNVRLVTGAPYSALGTSETVTTLPDGNRIVRQNRVRMWRDSDGRTRSEYSLSSIGGPLPLEVNTTVTVIDDPATRTRYMLQPSAKIACLVVVDVGHRRHAIAVVVCGLGRLAGLGFAQDVAQRLGTAGVVALLHASVE